MIWIKRNLLLVIGILVSVALLSFAGYYLYNSFYDNDDQDVALEQLKQELQVFQTGVYPSQENIDLVKSNTVLADAFMAEASRLLAPVPHKSITGPVFSGELARSIDRLRRDATNASVELPPKYEFTFGEIKAQGRILSYAVEPLLGQLSEVGTICGVLFKAKVRALESLQRVPAWNGDPGGADLLTDLAIQTNAVSESVNIVSTPYRITFRCFVSELSAVLNGFAQTKEAMNVRQLDVDAGGAAQQLAPGMDPTGMMQPGMMQPGMMQPGMMQPGMMQPGGLGGQPNFGLAPGGAAPVAAPAPTRPAAPARPGFGPAAPPVPKSSLTPILDEKPLRVTMVLNVMKVVRRPVAPVAAPAAAPPK